jgi:hypothetical protein
MNFNGGFLKVPIAVMDSNYYKYILNDTDKNILQHLWSNVSIGSSKYYQNGLLVANIKEQTLLEKTGETYPTLLRRLKRLDSLGVIIKKRHKVKHNRYLVGFRAKENERLYLLYHLINEYEEILKRNVANQMDEFTKKWQTPSIKDVSSFKMDGNYRKFIMAYFDRPVELINKRVKDGKTIFEILFNRKDVYRHPLPRLRELDFEGSK